MREGWTNGERGSLEASQAILWGFFGFKPCPEGEKRWSFWKAAQRVVASQGCSGRERAGQCRRRRFDPGWGLIPLQCSRLGVPGQQLAGYSLESAEETWPSTQCLLQCMASPTPGPAQQPSPWASGTHPCSLAGTHISVVVDPVHTGGIVLAVVVLAVIWVSSQRCSRSPGGRSSFGDAWVGSRVREWGWVGAAGGRWGCGKYSQSDFS